MTLTGFATWFQIFVGLNLAYVGSKNFRDYLLRLSEYFDSYTKNIEIIYDNLHNKIIDGIRQKSSLLDRNKKYVEKLEKLKHNFHNAEKIVELNGVIERDFINTFRPVFFFSAMLGLYCLFLCGYSDKIAQQEHINSLSIVNMFIIGLCILVFGYSLFSSKIDKPLNWTIIVFYIIIYSTIHYLIFPQQYCSFFVKLESNTLASESRKNKALRIPYF